jgi:ferrochelatase
MLPAGHPPVSGARVGVLIVNLGSPDAPTRAAVRRYLGQFLSDPRVIEIPPLVWQPILKGIILNTRPAKSAALYASIWDRARDRSPLVAITADQAAALGKLMPDVTVDYAMRYGKPAITERLRAMHAAGCTRILVAPLYPQYSAATTATVVDAVGACLHRMRWQPSLRFLPPYHDDAGYIGAVAASVRRHLDGLDFEPELIVASFHGMPARTLRLGDPYHCQARKTARLLAEALGRDVRIAFQSRFGRAKWLEPYFDHMLEALPGEGVGKLAVVAPGFAADCLETLEEIAIRGREAFMHAGGTHFAYVPSLNASAQGIEMMQHLIARELAGWRDSGQ